jgi:hypothetical protein
MSDTILINYLAQGALCENAKLKETPYILKQHKHTVQGNKLPDIIHT